jgi:lipid II:glycine glycyltransferase (peptidoglycan interpeptide bridge formation enzyme)
LDTWGGFSHFKEKFGGTIVEFPVPYVKYFNPIIKVISKLYGDKLSL